MYRHSENLLWRGSESVAPVDYTNSYRYCYDNPYRGYRPSSPEYNFMAASVISPRAWDVLPPCNEKLFTPPALLLECRMIVEESKRRRWGVSELHPPSETMYTPEYNAPNLQASYNPVFIAEHRVGSQLRESGLQPRVEPPTTSTISRISECTFTETQFLIPTSSDLPTDKTDGNCELPQV